MDIKWLAPVMALVVLACDKQPETPVGRSAAVIEKAPAPPPQVEARPAVTAPEPALVPAPRASAEQARPLPETAPVPKATDEPARPETAPVPKATDEPARPETAPAPAAYPLTVIDAALTDAVVDRLPSARKTTWKVGEDTKLIGWFELDNPGAQVEVDLVWKKNGKESWRFPTKVGSGKNWRTWAEKRIGKRDAGAWSVEVVDADGHVYETISYTIE